jgi:micrococcal nuclease
MARPAAIVIVIALVLVSGCASAAAPGGDGADDEHATARPTPTVEPTERPTATTTATASSAVEPTAAPALGEAPTGPTQVATVISVTDGDTIKVEIGGETFDVRYIGVSTPEIHGAVEWYGAEAHGANRRLVEGREVVLEKDVSETDRYGRLLRHVWVADGSGWLLVNAELVRQGVAQVTTYPPDVKYVDEVYLPAQATAVAGGIGLWAPQPTPVPTPAPIVPLVPQNNCEPSYPDFCLAIGTADLDCGDVQWRRFTVLWNVANPDPHRFDGEGDGIGCES